MRWQTLLILSVLTTSLPAQTTNGPEQPCVESASLTVQYGERLAEGQEARFPINLLACEMLAIRIVTDTSPTFGAYLSIKLYNTRDEEVQTDNWTATGMGIVHDVPLSRGSRGAECRPVYGVLKPVVNDISRYALTLGRASNPERNRGGNSFDNARVTTLPDHYTGNLCPMETGQFFRVGLEANQTIRLWGFAEGSVIYGAGFELELYNADRTPMPIPPLYLPAYGREPFSRTVTNPLSVPADFFIWVKTRLWEVYNFELNLDPE